MKFQEKALTLQYCWVVNVELLSYEPKARITPT